MQLGGVFNGTVHFYNHGQKCWDKLALLVFLPRRHYNFTCLTLPPTPYNIEN